MAGVLGIEPSLIVLETTVLPIYDTPSTLTILPWQYNYCQLKILLTIIDFTCNNKKLIVNN